MEEIFVFWLPEEEATIKDDPVGETEGEGASETTFDGHGPSCLVDHNHSNLFDDTHALLL